MTLHHSYRLRLLSAFVIAPITPAALVAVVLTICRASSGKGNVLEIVWFLKLGALLGYPIALACGLPLAFLFYRLHYKHPRIYVLTGGLLGAIDYFIYLLSEVAAHPTYANLVKHMRATASVLCPLGVTAGCIAGICFWLIARPDRRP